MTSAEHNLWLAVSPYATAYCFGMLWVDDLPTACIDTLICSLEAGE